VVDRDRHAGTFISAFLLLLRQKVAQLHQSLRRGHDALRGGHRGHLAHPPRGRPWFAYWLVPYPNVMSYWPQWRSPLVWDFFAISTYLIVSLVFWYVGTDPRPRDAARPSHLARRGDGVRPSSRSAGAAKRALARYEIAYLLLAGLAAPLVISVHTIVSLDFAVGNTPGYHSTIFRRTSSPARSSPASRWC
jgi:molybdopterin-containing oxidoreductase family membrane subunit